MQELANYSNYLLLALAALLLANGWRQNRQQPRPKGVIAVSVYFLAIAIPTIESLNSLLAFYGVLNLYAAAGVWYMRPDGRKSAVIMSWVNIGIVTLIALFIFGSARFTHELERLGAIGQTILVAILIVFASISIAIVRYLNNSNVASLSSTSSSGSKPSTKWFGITVAIFVISLLIAEQQSKKLKALQIENKKQFEEIQANAAASRFKTTELVYRGMGLSNLFDEIQSGHCEDLRRDLSLHRTAYLQRMNEKGFKNAFQNGRTLDQGLQLCEEIKSKPNPAAKR